ncbi:MAG TPA: citryl-CoA lyase [Ramlibacter sp.]|nr:citryl-CoA lyase [Ramlibacter sp.]
MKPRKKLTSRIAYSLTDQVVVKGHDLCQDILGRVPLGDMAFLMFMDRLPQPRESVMFNALAVALVEHGMTPSAIAARMTLAGAPEAMQAAIAAGLSGLGSIMVGSMEDAARMLQEALAKAPADADLDAIAARIFEERQGRGATVPGLGHRVHKPLDPRAERLFEIAREQGYEGRYVGLMRRLGTLAAQRSGKVLPINVTGAIGAIASEMGIPWAIVRGLGVTGRAVGLVGHIKEELDNPIAREIMIRVIDETQEEARAAAQKKSG